MHGCLYATVCCLNTHSMPSFLPLRHSMRDPPPPPQTPLPCRYVSQHQAHSALLTQFGALSSALGSVALPPQLQREGQWRVLADLQPRVKLAEWHESCSRSHTHFEQKVGGCGVVELVDVVLVMCVCGGGGDRVARVMQEPCTL